MILVGAQSLPMFLQGIAWVDQSDFSIVRLRTDLLEPRPETNVRRLATNIVFGPAHISGIDLTLWLPQSVDAEMESGGSLCRNSTSIPSTGCIKQVAGSFQSHSDTGCDSLATLLIYYSAGY